MKGNHPMGQILVTLMSETEYLELDDNAPEGVKYEFENGYVYAMAGGSDAHNAIQMNIYTLIGPIVKSGCFMRSSDQRVYLPTGRYYYSDAVIFCPKKVARGRRGLENPNTVFEVLSRKTERRDRGDKRIGYCSIPSCVEYILISQVQIAGERYIRKDEIEWSVKQIGPADYVYGDVRLRDLYTGTEGLETDKVNEKVRALRRVK